MSLQEKFQTVLPAKPEAGHEWESLDSARTTGEVGFMHANNSTGFAECRTKLNYLPPGMDINNAKRKRIEQMPFVLSGQSDVTVTPTGNWVPEKGFTRLEMDPCSDAYTGEHIDLFYGEAKDEEGHVGFCERQNYLDRL